MADTEVYQPQQKYTPVRAFAAEGARVGIVTCTACGSALLIDPDDVNQDLDVLKTHDEWHASLENGVAT